MRNSTAVRDIGQ